MEEKRNLQLTNQTHSHSHSIAKMDFSKLNGAEQAHMTKYIEKKQVSLSYSFIQQIDERVLRCKISCTCIHPSSKDVSRNVVMTLLRKHLARKRFVSPPLSSLTDAIQETCVLNCADKFMKHTERVGARFAELNGVYLLLFHFSVIEIE